MEEERIRVLNMLANGNINVEESPLVSKSCAIKGVLRPANGLIIGKGDTITLRCKRNVDDIGGRYVI